jgi:predicted RNA-binding Zn ribbon-like protein
MAQRGSGVPRFRGADVPPEEEDIARCLAFVNTLSGRATDAPSETLISYEALVDWARGSGLLRADDADRLATRAKRRQEEAGRVVTDARELRELLHDTFTATSAGKTPAAGTLDDLSALVSGWYRHGRLVPCGTALNWCYSGGEDLDRVLWEIARTAARLLTSPRLSRVRACAVESCGWWFLDDSKNASRRWCDMKICGNREKIRRFRDRQKA